jgi:hypothetical protein
MDIQHLGVEDMHAWRNRGKFDQGREMQPVLPRNTGGRSNPARETDKVPDRDYQQLFCHGGMFCVDRETGYAHGRALAKG